MRGPRVMTATNHLRNTSDFIFRPRQMGFEGEEGRKEKRKRKGPRKSVFLVVLVCECSLFNRYRLKD